ncbi:hypothetical protein B296_00027933, partial [Ensete ventricosum]
EEAKADPKPEEDDQQKDKKEKQEETKKEEVAEKKAAEAKPSPPSAIVLSLDLHCVGCARKIEKLILKCRGVTHSLAHSHFGELDRVQTVETDFGAGKITVTGTMKAETLVEHIHRRTLKFASIVSQPPKEEEKKQEDEKKAEEKPAEEKKEESTQKKEEQKANSEEEKTEGNKEGGDIGGSKEEKGGEKRRGRASPHLPPSSPPTCRLPSIAIATTLSLGHLTHRPSLPSPAFPPPPLLHRAPSPSPPSFAASTSAAAPSPFSNRHPTHSHNHRWALLTLMPQPPSSPSAASSFVGHRSSSPLFYHRRPSLPSPTATAATLLQQPSPLPSLPLLLPLPRPIRDLRLQLPAVPPLFLAAVVYSQLQPTATLLRQPPSPSSLLNDNRSRPRSLLY